MTAGRAAAPPQPLPGGTDGTDLLRLVRPLPGFPGLDRFRLVAFDSPPTLYELCSEQQEAVRFAVADPSVFFPDYAVELDEGLCALLGLEAADDAAVLVLLTVGADAASTTANLLAPVVVNVRTRSAAQVILTGSGWPVRAEVV